MNRLHFFSRRLVSGLIINKSDSDLFIVKPETTVLEKKCNRFIRVGSIYDYNEKNNIKLVKEIDILEFLKNCK